MTGYRWSDPCLPSGQIRGLDPRLERRVARRESWKLPLPCDLGLDPRLERCVARRGSWKLPLPYDLGLDPWLERRVARRASAG